MGASSSATRKLTVENDDPTSVIKVSEEVVDRLRGSQTAVSNKGRQQGPLSQVDQSPLYWNPSNLTSQQIQEVTAGELQKNDHYWQQRIKNLEEKHKKINQVMEDEYVKAVNEFTVKKIERNLPPCKATEVAVKECYSEYPNQPMRCAKVVQAFQECVDLKRNTLLSSRG